MATLEVQVSAQGYLRRIGTFSGRRFVPDFKLALVAYPNCEKAKPLVIGLVRRRHTGAFDLHDHHQPLPSDSTFCAPGQ